MRDLQEIILELSDAFIDVVQWVKFNVPREHHYEYFNAETFGGLSAFLELGNGYEPAFYKGATISDLERFEPETSVDE